jgi:hypothetical protein
MPVGSSANRAVYPSLASWRLVLRELEAAFAGASFFLVGKLVRDERTSSKLTRAEADELLGVCRHTLDCFDRPLLEQLAIVESCAVFVSPHTGFGMAALAVGTPWLTLAGGRWFESFFNAVPFYSVIPDTKRYPCYPGWTDPLPVLDADMDGEGPRTPSMSAARIREDLPELVDAARALAEGRLSYEDALERHFERLLRAVDGERGRIYSFDGAHRPYV